MSSVAEASTSKIIKFGQFLRRALFQWNYTKFRHVRIVVSCFSVLGTGYACLKKVPAGHVGLVQYRDGSLKPAIYDDRMIHIYIPFYQTPVSIRVLPVKKKFIRDFTTKDGKRIEVLMQARLQPRIPYVHDIYLKFGRDYGRGFIEKECAQDLTNIIREHTYDELIKNDNYTDEVVNDLAVRFEEACAFHKLKITEVAVIFREPDSGEEY